MEEDKYKIISTHVFGTLKDKKVGINILKNNFGKYSFQIIYPNDVVINWHNCSNNRGEFLYDSEKGVFIAAMDYIINHATFEKIYDEDFLNFENPEDNIEEIPEDFQLNMKK